ncbi:hypothetical protein LguiA_018447 [Lonicera macranthoides]
MKSHTSKEHYCQERPKLFLSKAKTWADLLLLLITNIQQKKGGRHTCDYEKTKEEKVGKDEWSMTMRGLRLSGIENVNPSFFFSIDD